MCHELIELVGSPNIYSEDGGGRGKGKGVYAINNFPWSLRGAFDNNINLGERVIDL